MSIVQFCNGKKIAQVLGLKQNKNDYYGACPSCGYPTGFTISEKAGKSLFYCHAGGCSFEEISASLHRLGLWRSKTPSEFYQVHDAKVAKSAIVPHSLKSSAKVGASDCYSKLIEKLWNQSLPAENTLVEEYLKCRGIQGAIPSSLRFLPKTLHTPSRTEHPVMLSAVNQINTDVISALHRTYLRFDGKGKADVEPAKMMLGKVQGGSVHLSEPLEEVLAVTEGVETGLSVQQVTGLSVWAALSTGGLKSLLLPDSIKRVIIFCDNDSTQGNPGIQAAQVAAKRWWAEGLKVELRIPPIGYDFNDLLGEGQLA
ncbi:MAG: toprim domain-containing protein [Cyanobacteria bacterium]|nr:toprim domain-containing protein [Cyanobacteriota bacterium]